MIFNPIDAWKSDMSLREFNIDKILDIMLHVQQATLVGTVYSLEAKDEYSCMHSERVALMSKKFAEVLELPQSECRLIDIAASIHDIGKIGIKDDILLAERRLTDEEFAIMKTHSEKGAEIFEKTTDAQREVFADRIFPMAYLAAIESIKSGILHHHERWDGKGYPSGLKKEDIPFVARVIALCDSTDAMMSNRVYRKALPVETSKKEIENNAGVMYDPELAKRFLDHWDEIVTPVYSSSIE